MTKRSLQDPAKPSQPSEHVEHSVRIGPGPKPGPKRSVNLSLDAEILDVAKEMNINLSQTLESTLRKLTEDERIRRWQDEHQAYFESYNAFMERHGTLAEAVYELDDPAI